MSNKDVISECALLSRSWLQSISSKSEAQDTNKYLCQKKSDGYNN